MGAAVPDVPAGTSFKRVNWTEIRDKFAVPVSGLLAAGLIIMWWANLTSLLTVGGFIGIEGWLLPGIVLVAISDWLLFQRMRKEWAQMNWKQRRRLLWQFIPMTGNLAANIYAIYLIEFNIQVGLLRRGMWDRWCLGIATATLALTVIVKWIIDRRIAKNGELDEADRRSQKSLVAKASIATISVGTRAVQQSMLVLSPQLMIIPLGTPVGLIVIASFKFLLSWVEHKAARQNSTAGEREAQLIKWADGCNAIAALILLLGWIAKHSGLL